jgi:hypothetical protein
MKLLAGSIGILVWIIGTASVADRSPGSYQAVSDSLIIELQPHFDSLGLLEIYCGKVSTPVCEGSKCYTIEILFYWDLIGRFHHFDTIAGKGLTKLDHIPFTTKDYEKLNLILRSPTSLLSAYSKEELVKESRSSAIDGKTGATKAELKQSVIEGAVYSCHTLWHIAQGPMVDELQSVTQQLFTKDLIQKMVSREDQWINYFLINHFSAVEFTLYLPEVLKTIEDGEGYFAKNAIEKMPEDIINCQEALQFFAIHFNDFDYYAQVALLQKLQSESLSTSMKEKLGETLDERDSYRNDLIKTLI